MKDIKIPKETLDEIKKIGEEEINKKLFLSDEDFDKLKNPVADINGQKETQKDKLYNAYNNILDMLKEYCDLREDYYPIIAVWIIGTYFHNNFETYPYLFLNAMRGSGKTRTLKLITKFSCDGELQASLTEAVLFRTTGTLGLDEFEGMNRKGNENLKELLNAAYKKGIKVKRMKKKKTSEGEEQVVEEFNVYRPICMANIWGMEEVLGDRCISIVLEKSSNEKITKKVEIYEYDLKFKETKKILEELKKGDNQCSLCNVVSPLEVYREWNKYISYNYTNTYTTYIYNKYINYLQLFKRLNLIGGTGRELELVFPLILISSIISEKTLEELFSATENYIKEKREDQFAESVDISLIDYVSQEMEVDWQKVSNVTKGFREFLQTNEDWINDRWMGRALKRLNLIKEKRRLSFGVQVMLDVPKAKEKIKMFK